MIPTQPIGHGGGRLAVLETAGFRVDETLYPQDLKLASHQHDRANLCIVLDGALTEFVGRSARVCEASTLILKPQGEVHHDHFHRDGAHCINIAVAHDRLASIRDIMPALNQVHFAGDPALISTGHRIRSELAEMDDLSGLAIEGLVLELIAQTVRSLGRQRAGAPGWLDEARDFLHASYCESVGLSAIAQAVHRHPVHVAQHFRRRFGVSVGEYIRRLRVEHVARRLLSSDAPLAILADEAGFSDQSHMQRVFKARIGVTPAAYRRSRRDS